MVQQRNLQSLLQRYSQRAKLFSRFKQRRARRDAQQNHHYYGGAAQQQRQTTGLDIAKFGLLSIATLPFSLWVATFSYDYVYRISLCQDALAAEDDEISYIRSLRRGLNIGRETQLAEVKDLLSKEPHQIVVVAGANESGKSRFVAEVLRDVPLAQGVTYIQLAQIVDSLSTLTHALVNSFGLKWLQMRHALVDVLPFAGSEILVMKERFSDRDLAQALLVITEALKAKASEEKDPSRRPVIVIDGLGEGSTWIRSPEGKGALERLIKWCIFITKERRLAHVVLTGNEELVISLTDQNRNTRGHVKVVGLADLSEQQAGQIVLQELPSAHDDEVEKIIDVFGGFIHDVQAVSREINSLIVQRGPENVDNRDQIVEDAISARFLLQLERVTAAFAKGRSSEDEQDDGNQGDDEPEEMDPYLDPLKATYSEARARQVDLEQSETSESASWSQLQLWQTLQKLVESERMAVPFADLRDEIFDGSMTPLIELMNEDVLGFEVASSSASGWSWEVKPATPALGRAFQHLVNNSRLKERFHDIGAAQENRDKLEDIEGERRRLRKERRRLELRKASLQNTVALGQTLGVKNDKELEKRLQRIYNTMVSEEIANEERGRELREEMAGIIKQAQDADANGEESIKEELNSEKPARHEHSSIRDHLKQAILQSYVQESSKDKFVRFRASFDQIAKNGDGGITAADLVRLIKVTSGEDVDLEAAQSFVRAWDADEDARLDYDEFVRMLLTDPKMKAKRSKAEG